MTILPIFNKTISALLNSPKAEQKATLLRQIDVCAQTYIKCAENSESQKDALRDLIKACDTALDSKLFSRKMTGQIQDQREAASAIAGLNLLSAAFDRRSAAMEAERIETEKYVKMDIADLLKIKAPLP